ncbi:MAG TPA: hypothetical protein VL172_18680, partial [Kofleriaceae bacterium]|nr:hypothetical protein [Kofleriaceae bacterium]
MSDTALSVCPDCGYRGPRDAEGRCTRCASGRADQTALATLVPGPPAAASTLPPRPVEPATPGPGGSPADPHLTIRPERTLVMAAPTGEAAPLLAGGYRIETELARGGMATVYTAEQLAFGRVVAVKALLPEIRDPRVARWFRAEAVVTALLEHPNIMPVYDLIAGPGGEARLVMKKIDG